MQTGQDLGSTFFELLGRYLTGTGRKYVKPDYAVGWLLSCSTPHLPKITHSLDSIVIIWSEQTDVTRSEGKTNQFHDRWRPIWPTPNYILFASCSTLGLMNACRYWAVFSMELFQKIFSQVFAYLSDSCSERNFTNDQNNDAEKISNGIMVRHYWYHITFFLTKMVLLFYHVHVFF